MESFLHEIMVRARIAATATIAVFLFMLFIIVLLKLNWLLFSVAGYPGVDCA